MSFNTFGKFFRFTTWGESHGPAIGCVVDGCPPNIKLNIRDIQLELNKRKPGQSKFTTQRKEDDKVEILSGTFEGKTTGTPISMIIFNKDMRSKDYKNLDLVMLISHILKNMELEIIEVEADSQRERLLQEWQQGQ